MKRLIHPILIVGMLLFAGSAFANDEYIFPKIGAEYRMTYSALKSAKPSDQQGAPDERSVTLKILKVQSNGWVLAATIYYEYPRSEPTPEKPLGEIQNKIKKEAPPTWYNLNSFSQAFEIKEK